MAGMIDLGWADWCRALAGGALIGLAAGLLMLGAGRIAGISGLVSRALDGTGAERWLALLFVAGLPLGALLVAWAGGAPRVELPSTPILLLAGVIVGIGTRLGNGCTSGHAVCGMARLSPRSIAATLVFMAVAMVVVAVMRGRIG
jgi:uncharacterized protein